MVVVYRPPSVPIAYLRELELVLQHMYLTYEEVTLLEDINIDPLMSEHNSSRKFMNIIRSLNVTQTVTESTRIGANPCSLLDVLSTTRNLTATTCTDICMKILITCLLSVSLIFLYLL